jgi:hypothetical protein
MNNQQLTDFLNKIRQNIESLTLIVSKGEVDTKEASLIIKETKNNLTHLQNILRAEESLREMKVSSR